MIMLRIALIEIKARKRWSKRFLLMLMLLSVITTTIAIHSILSGIKVDYGIYSSNLDLDSPLFVRSENPDIVICNDRVMVSGNLKSLSAFDEFRNYIRAIYNQWIYDKFGSSAFPVLIRVVRVPTKVEFREITVKDVKRIVEIAKEEKKQGKEIKPKKITPKVVKKIEGKKIKTERSEFLTPDELKPPSLLSKLIYAFGFIIPIYFVIQVYSSSTVEDKMKRRLELLFVAEDEWMVLFGKMMPYLISSIVLGLVTMAALGKNITGIIFLIPIILFLLSLSTFTAMISRSYKEMTFLTIIISIFITVYLFIPAIFTAIPMSKISPITLLLMFFEDGKIDIREYVISSIQFYVMSAVLFTLSLNSLEVMHAQANPIEKVITITTGVMKRYWIVFLASLLSIPFVFVIEFFTLSIIFMVEHAFAAVILLVAVIEEFFKGLFIYSAFKNGLNPYLSAILSASGFLIGEKILLFTFIPARFIEYIPIPLVAHMLSAMIFVLTMRFGFKQALVASATFHAIYDEVILWNFSRLL